MDIVEFFNARLDEDQQVARAATPGPWLKTEPYPGQGAIDSPTGNIANENDQGDIEPVDAEHIARHDPARVLAEVAAKRAIIGEHRPALWQPECFGCSDSWPCLTLRAFANVYADHPDFDPAWAPVTSPR